MRVAILGLGEAGGRFARDLLAAGTRVAGWDPAPGDLPDGLELASSNAAAAREADVVLSVNLAAAAQQVASEVAATLAPGALFAEMNTASPGLKRQIASSLSNSPEAFVDVAIMAPVPPLGLRTPMLVSGPGADEFQRRMKPFGMRIEVVDDQPGSAATRKLVRSIAYKGIAAVVIECLEAARKLDLEEYARVQLGTLVEPELIDRFEAGSRKHARRRIHEMEAVQELLESIGVEPYTSTAALERLERLRSED